MFWKFISRISTTFSQGAITYLKFDTEHKQDTDIIFC